jgi:hypothetical protein
MKLHEQKKGQNNSKKEEEKPRVIKKNQIEIGEKAIKQEILPGQKYDEMEKKK